jgi:ABC-type multidrug transport system fused ATPase/permease subunit
VDTAAPQAAPHTRADKFDFHGTAERLESRARKSRYRLYAIGSVLLVVVSVFAFVIVNRIDPSILAGPIRVGDRVEVTYTPSSDVAWSFSTRVLALMSSINGPMAPSKDTKFTPPSGEELAKIEKQLDMALLRLKQAREVDDVARRSDSGEKNWVTRLVSTTVLGLGAVVFVLLLIQIAVMFMRYYARLAEFYDAQVDALKASNGDPEIAIRFMEQFSPASIDIGKSPGTLYEKALDTIQSVAQSRGAPPT